MRQQYRTILIASTLLVVAGCDSDQQVTRAEDGVRFTVVEAPEACVQDLVTGLTWEQKSAASGLRDWRNTYSWFNPTQAHKEMDYRGTAGAGVCDGSECDTWAYVAAVNATHYCGFDDWRLPSRDELFSISDLQKAKTPPTIDMVAFPHTQAAEYWSTHDYSFQPDSAWAWNFRYGHDRVDWKKVPKYVRLVRGDGDELAVVKE